MLRVDNECQIRLGSTRNVSETERDEGEVHINGRQDRQTDMGDSLRMKMDKL